LQQKLSAINQFTTNRMLWATALNALQHVPMDGVQIVRVHTEQQYSVNEGGKASSDAKGAAAKAATATEKITLQLDGRDYSARPGDQVPRYKESLAKDPYFKSALQKTNDIQLITQTAPQTDQGTPYVGFGLQLSFEEKERRLYD